MTGNHESIHSVKSGPFSLVLKIMSPSDFNFVISLVFFCVPDSSTCCPPPPPNFLLSVPFPFSLPSFLLPSIPHISLFSSTSSHSLGCCSRGNSLYWSLLGCHASSARSVVGRWKSGCCHCYLNPLTPASLLCGQHH